MVESSSVLLTNYYRTGERAPRVRPARLERLARRRGGAFFLGWMARSCLASVPPRFVRGRRLGGGGLDGGVTYRPAFARAREDGPNWLGVGGREGSVLVRC